MYTRCFDYTSRLLIVNQYGRIRGARRIKGVCGADKFDVPEVPEEPKEPQESIRADGLKKP
jgi:hypothetical protein